MNYEILIGALTLVGLLAGVIKPLITLNTNITALKASVDQLKDIIQELKDRITTHGQEIDKINIKLENHETRISSLEKD